MLSTAYIHMRLEAQNLIGIETDGLLTLWCIHIIICFCTGLKKYQHRPFRRVLVHKVLPVYTMFNFLHLTLIMCLSDRLATRLLANVKSLVQTVKLTSIAKLKSFHQNDSVQPKQKQQAKQGSNHYPEDGRHKANNRVVEEEYILKPVPETPV